MGALTVLPTIDISAPVNYTVAFDINTVTDNETGTTTITISGAEVGSTYSYTITSSRRGDAVTASGTISSSSMQITVGELSNLMHGTIKLLKIV